MTTSSVTSAATSQLISALGAGSGVDMSALANTLAEAQFATKAERLTTRSETLDRQISEASNLKSMMLSLASSLAERVRAGDLSAQPSVANGSVAKASLTGSSQPGGTYSLEVTALASGQILSSPAYAASTASTGSGTLTLRFGSTADGVFTEDAAHPAVTVNIASGATLSDAAAAINAAKSGVTAYVAKGADGARLVLKGSEGQANGFILEANETPGDEGLANLAWSPADGASGRLLGSAANAAFSVDGLAMTSASNSVAEVVPGVSLMLTGTNAGAATTLSFSDPAEAITGAMQDLTAALNEIAGEIRSATNPLTGDLSSDSGARQLRQTFSMLAGTVIMPNAAAGSPRSLADLGLSTQRDGTFALDSSRLSATLKNNPQGAAAMFTNGLYGIYATVDSLARRASKASDPGTLAGSVARYTKLKTQITEDQAKVADRQEALRVQLVKRFAAVDTAVGASNSTMSLLQNQIDAWNAQKN